MSGFTPEFDDDPEDPGPITERQAEELGAQVRRASELTGSGAERPADTRGSVPAGEDDRPVRPTAASGLGDNVPEATLPPPVDELHSVRHDHHVADVDLPLDILRVWGGSDKDLTTARTLVAAWGVDAFRTSAIHQLALSEIERADEKRGIQRAFVKAMKKKEKK